MTAPTIRSGSPTARSAIALSLLLSACAVDQTTLDGAPNDGPPPPLTEGQTPPPIDEGGGLGGAPPYSCVPGGDDTPMPVSPRAYASMCAPELGLPPVVDCGAGVPIPITVDGVEVFEDPGLHACDNPSLQMGDCMPGSSVQRYPGFAIDGTPRPEVVWVSFCRHDGRDDVFGFDVGDSVQMIGYNAETGATCFFESGDNSRWTSVDENNRLVGVLPGFDDPAFDEAFAVPGPADIQCVQCHQADPFVHNPWINGARLPEDPTQPVIPVIPGANPPYYVVGAPNWDMRTIHIEGNACLGCHRIGMETLFEFTGDRWDPNAHMPPHDPGSMAGDLQALLDCWSGGGPAQTPGCEWIVPPGGGCDGGTVGAGYPYAAPDFNLAADEGADDQICQPGDWIGLESEARGLGCDYDCADGRDFVADAGNAPECPDPLWTLIGAPCDAGDRLIFGITQGGVRIELVELITCTDGAWPELE